MQDFFWTSNTRATGFGAMIIFIALVMLWEISGANDACPTVTINNGSVETSKDGDVTMLRYRCNKGFIRYGVIMSYCTPQGRWLSPPPTCIKNGCLSLLNTPIANGHIQVETKYKQAVTSFTCDQDYARQGPNKLLCDGFKWSDEIPRCVKVEVNLDKNLTCDFEDNYLCGWSQNTDQVTEWIQWAGPTYSSSTGPDTDHTHRTPSGHYLYIESTFSSPKGKFADFTSMIFSPNSSRNLCLEFYFHMMGADIGSLEVHVKQVTNNNTGEMISRPSLVIEGNQGSQWNRGYVQIPEQHQPFQIVFRGILNGIRGDIAVDDINIYMCSQLKLDSNESQSNYSSESSAYRCSNVSNRDVQTIQDETEVVVPINKSSPPLQKSLGQPDVKSYKKLDPSSSDQKNIQTASSFTSACDYSQSFSQDKTEITSENMKSLCCLPNLHWSTAVIFIIIASIIIFPIYVWTI